LSATNKALATGVAIAACAWLLTSCSGSGAPNDLATASDFPDAKGGSLIYVGVLGPLTQDEVDAMRKRCGHLPTVRDVVAAPQQIVIRSTSFSPMYLQPIRSCAQELSFVRFVD